MTIPATASEKAYSGDGVSTVFAIPFAFDTAADLKLTSTDSAGNILTLSTGFTISGGGGSTGNATFSVAPVVGVTITIYDNPAQTQPTNYVSLDAFPAESHEKALDRVTRIVKRLSQLVQRAVRFPDGDVSTDGVLGSVANRKGKYLFFNAITGAIEYAANVVTTTLSQSIIGQLLYPQTPAEIAAGITPTNYFYVPGHVQRYGADPTGVADSTTAFNNAGLALGTTGGTVIIPPSGKFKINSSITVPVGVQWKGEFNGQAASRTMAAGSINFAALGCSIALAPAATITLLASASIAGLIIYNSALTYPTTNSAGFSGTAITIGGPDTYVGRSLIVGFTKGILSSGFERLKCEWVLGDNNTGIEITLCNDVPKIAHCHMWPFASYVPSVSSLTNYHRTGSAYYLHDTVDGAQVTDNFCYGYMQGFNLSNVSTAHLTGNFTDGTALLAGSCGFLFNGNINAATVVACGAWNATNGYNFTMNVGQEVHLGNCTASGNTGSGIIVTSGNVRITSNFINASPYALTYNNNANASVVHFDQNTMATLGTRPILCNFSTTNLVIGEGNFWIDGAFGTSFTGNVNDALPQIASAATLALPQWNNSFLITGTTTIATITGGYADRVIKLTFNNTLAVSYGTGADQSILNYGQAFNAVSGATLSLMHDGFAWKEIGRSVPTGSSTGWGTPTGAAAVGNFPAATATTLQTNQAVASIIAALKSIGIFTV